MYYGLSLVFVIIIIIFFLDKAVFLRGFSSFKTSGVIFNPLGLFLRRVLGVQIYKIIDDHFCLLVTQN